MFTLDNYIFDQTYTGYVVELYGAVSKKDLQMVSLFGDI